MVKLLRALQAPGLFHRHPFSLPHFLHMPSEEIRTPYNSDCGFSRPEWLSLGMQLETHRSGKCTSWWELGHSTNTGWNEILFSETLLLIWSTRGRRLQWTQCREWQLLSPLAFVGEVTDRQCLAMWGVLLWNGEQFYPQCRTSPVEETSGLFSNLIPADDSWASILWMDHGNNGHKNEFRLRRVFS